MIYPQIVQPWVLPGSFLNSLLINLVYIDANISNKYLCPRYTSITQEAFFEVFFFIYIHSGVNHGQY